VNRAGNKNKPALIHVCGFHDTPKNLSDLIESHKNYGTDDKICLVYAGQSQISSQHLATATNALYIMIRLNIATFAKFCTPLPTPQI
jgi:hypothetical protein